MDTDPNVDPDETSKNDFFYRCKSFLYYRKGVYNVQTMSYETTYPTHFFACQLSKNLTSWLWLFVGPTGVYLLDFFCSSIQFYSLLSPYLSFISFLYLDLYIRGVDAFISYGSFMQTKYLCVLIHI